MSLFQKMFGSKSFEDHAREGDELFARKQFGESKLAYDRALEKRKQAPPEAVERVEKRILETRDAIARERMEIAESFAREGDHELATTELEHAFETAATDEVRKLVRAQIDGLERREARVLAGVDTQVSDDELYEAMSGSWEPEQLDEYESYGAPMRAALIALDKEESTKAHEALEALLVEAKDPHYLHYEAARARLAIDDSGGAEKAFRAFLASIGPDEGGSARFVSHRELASLADARGDTDAAEKELEDCIAVFDEHPLPYINYGVYLRSKGRAEESIEVLEAAIPFMGEVSPVLDVLEQLGLSHLALGHKDEAKRYFQSVIDQRLASQRTSQRRDLNVNDFSPVSGEALAKLHEESGELTRAADLYRSLARGSNRARHFTYSKEAGRLLTEIGLSDEARKMLQRASELAPDEAEKAAISVMLAKVS